MSITKFNINADFIAYQQITASGLSHLSGRAYKTEGGIFALCSKGSLKTIINHTEYRIGVNELIVVPPETFVQLLTASDDVEIHGCRLGIHFQRMRWLFRVVFLFVYKHAGISYSFL